MNKPRSAERGEPAQWRNPAHQRAAHVARADHHVGAFVETPQHVRDLRGIMRVVAIHDDKNVVVICVGHGVLDQRAQASAEPLVDRAIENHERHLLLPASGDRNGRIGAAVVVEHDRDRQR